MRPLATLVKAMCATTRCTSLGCMGLVTRSFFPAGLGAGKGGIELSHGPGHALPGIEWVLVAGSPGCDKKGEGCGERMKEKERDRRALLSWLRRPVSFESFVVRHGVLLEGGFSFLSLCHCVVFTVLSEFSMR